MLLAGRCRRTGDRGRRLARSAVLAGWAMATAWVGVPSVVHAGPALTIGAIVPQSWPSATEGEEIILGMQLAIKTWPGQPTPTLVIKDSACDPRKVDAAARELVAAKVDLVLGSWCAIGLAPTLVSEAGIHYVSAHAERLAKVPDGVSQLGRIEVYAAERIASALRTETGLRISARTSCWMDFEPVLREQYDAVLCPALGFDKTRWQQAEATFTAALRRPFTFSVARGYAAMEVALAQLKRLRSNSKSNEPIVTILGPLPANGAPPAPDAMQLVFGAKMPRLSPKEQATVNQLIATKACTCLADNSCSKPGPWADQPFVVRGTNAKCPALASPKAPPG